MKAPLSRLRAPDPRDPFTWIVALFVLDPQGDVRYDMRATDPQPVNRAGWPAFQQHRDDPDPGLHVSIPVTQPDGREVVILSRRLSRPAGEFAGVVLGTIRLDALLQVLGRQNVDGVSISLIRTDGILLARYPYRPGDGGADLNGHPIMRSFRAAQTGNFDAIAPNDGVHHFTSYAAVPRMPLLVRVAYDGEASLSVWRRQAYANGGLIGALLLCQLALTSGLWRHIGAQAEAEAAQNRLALKVDEIAHVDEVSGLPNRRRFDQDFEVEWRRMMRGRGCLSLLLIDIDHFTLYSQSHGTVAGDVVLAAIARCITGPLRRPGDVAARYSEAMFAIILPDTPREGAETVARAIHRALEVAHLEFPASNHERVTVSIGIATATHGPEPGSISCFEAADAALCEAREAGHNRIVASTARIALT